jgi:hypothetical protein
MHRASNSSYRRHRQPYPVPWSAGPPGHPRPAARWRAAAPAGGGFRPAGTVSGAGVALGRSPFAAAAAAGDRGSSYRPSPGQWAAAGAPATTPQADSARQDAAALKASVEGACRRCLQAPARRSPIRREPQRPGRRVRELTHRSEGERADGAGRRTDMPGYPGVLREVARVLCPGGIFVHIGTIPASAADSPTAVTRSYWPSWRGNSPGRLSRRERETRPCRRA